VTEIVVTSYTPTLDTGRGRRVYGIVRALAEHDDVHVVYNVFGAAAPSTAFDLPRIRLHPVASSRGARRGLAYARALAGGVPAMFARGVSPELAAYAAAVAGSEAGARIVADGPTAAAALLGLARRRPVVYNTHNIESDLRIALADPGTSRAARLFAFERRLLQTFAETWTVSAADTARARERPLRSSGTCRTWSTSPPSRPSPTQAVDGCCSRPTSRTPRTEMRTRS
jgi:hypothetical protein